MGTRAAKTAPASAPVPGLALGDGSALAAVLAEFVRVVREEARAAVRKKLATERPRQSVPATEESLRPAGGAGRVVGREMTGRYRIQARDACSLVPRRLAT